MIKTAIVLAAAMLLAGGPVWAQTRPTVPGYGPKCFVAKNFNECVSICSSGACDPNATPVSCKTFCKKKFG
jgi:hypothetical protein